MNNFHGLTTSDTSPGPYVPDVNLFHVFDWRWIQLKTFVGAMVILAFVITSVLNAVFLRLMVWRYCCGLVHDRPHCGVPRNCPLPLHFYNAFVQIRRAKKCLDFTATLYGIHLILVWSTYGLPRTKTWWVAAQGVLDEGARGFPV